MRRNATDAERLLWSRLRNRQIGGARFRRQHPAGGFIVDFLCVDAKLMIEVDGGQHAENAGADRERDARLAQAGYRVLRFWNNEVLGNVDGVLEVIAEAVAVAARVGDDRDVAGG